MYIYICVCVCIYKGLHINASTYAPACTRKFKTNSWHAQLRTILTSARACSWVCPLQLQLQAQASSRFSKLSLYLFSAPYFRGAGSTLFSLCLLTFPLVISHCALQILLPTKIIQTSKLQSATNQLFWRNYHFECKKNWCN